MKIKIWKDPYRNDRGEAFWTTAVIVMWLAVVAMVVMAAPSIERVLGF